jgi:large subunit ribosomal protein L10
MSKYVKNLLTEHLRQRLHGVQDALLVNVVGLHAGNNHRLRSELKKKNIHLMVVKNSLAARATAGTPLAPLFQGLNGTAAICWGSEDVVTLAKEITRLVKDPQFAPFTARGGIIDGQLIPQEQVAEVSKWPSRTEMLSILAGQIMAPAGRLAALFTAVGETLCGQIAERTKQPPTEAAAPTPAEEESASA